MRIFKHTWFDRFANKERIADDELREIVEQLEVGQVEADLGGGMYKVRLARPGEGKSGGYRIIVFFKSEERTFYVYGFTKSKRSNIDQKETREYKKLAKRYLNLSDAILESMITAGKLIEI